MNLQEIIDYVTETAEACYLYDLPTSLAERLKLVVKNVSFRKYGCTISFTQDRAANGIIQITEMDFIHREALINIVCGSKEVIIRVQSRYDDREA